MLNVGERRQLLNGVLNTLSNAQFAKAVADGILGPERNPELISELEKISDDLIKSVNEWKVLIPKIA